PVYRSLAHRVLPSFPTRRSSDLEVSVIRALRTPHKIDVETAEPTVPPPEAELVAVAAYSDADGHARITAIVRAHHDFIWRLLRRLGLPQASADDATQQVFCIAARRVADIAPCSERSFL